MDKLTEAAEQAYDQFFEQMAMIDKVNGQTAKNRAMTNSVFVFEELYKLAYDRGLQSGYTLGHGQGYEAGIRDWVKRNDNANNKN